MLKKLLKYDFRALFKYWWLVAISSVGIAVVAGFAFRVVQELSNKQELTTLEGWMLIFSSLGMILGFMGLVAFLVAAEIFIYIRLYKHFFSDEGYLTFTLPVKRRDLLASKLISGFAVNLATVLVLIADIFIFLLVSIDFEDISNTLKVIGKLTEELFKALGWVSAAYIAEAIVLILCVSVSSYLFIAFCMTFAAIIAKKYKIFAAIGIYYVVSAMISFVGQFGFMFGVMGLAGLLSSIPEGLMTGVIALILFSVCAIAVAITYALYTLELYLLDKKLNLA